MARANAETVPETVPQNRTCIDCGDAFSDGFRWAVRCAPCGAKRLPPEPPKTAPKPSRPRIRPRAKRAPWQAYGLRAHPLYSVWSAMVARCLNPKVPHFDRYGGRGIQVCDRWRDSLEAFAQDMGPRPEGYTVERIDNDGHYEPGNCRWASRWEQGQNRHDTIRFEYQGQPRTVAEIIRLTGTQLSHTTLSSRLLNGWTVERATSEPVIAKFSRRRP